MKTPFIFPLLFIFAFLTLSRNVNSITISLEEIIQTYDSTTRPQLRGSVLVNVSLLINFLEIDDKRQMIKLSGEMQQEWDDIHLRFSGSPRSHDSIGLQGARGDKIKQHLWLPDVTIANGINEIKHHGSDFLKIDGDGHMIWTQQVFFEFPCEMDFSEYPVGEQECTIKLQSLGYDINELEPRWAGEESVYYNYAQVTESYTIEHVDTAATAVVTIHTAKRQLQATLEMERVTGWTVKHTVLPFIATVTTAYLSFFINIRAITARITLSVVSFLIAAVFHESTYQNIQTPPYTMAIEIFTGTCLTFIWVAIVQTVMVDVLVHLPSKGGSSSHTSFSMEHTEIVEDGDSSKCHLAALWLDRCFRVLYPAFFLAFNAVFWILYH